MSHECGSHAYLCCAVEAVLMPLLPISSASLIFRSSSLFSSKSFSFSSITVWILSFSWKPARARRKDT